MNEKTITITETEYKAIVEDIVMEMLNDEQLNGVGKLFIPLIGITFATAVSRRLFEDKEGVQ